VLRVTPLWAPAVPVAMVAAMVVVAAALTRGGMEGR
jgi:hypothetical protein